jgi:hypothetical protein
VNTGSVDGVGNVNVVPPSAVRTSTEPPRVAATQSVALAHEIDVRSWPEPASLATHVAPPSAVLRNSDWSPTA